MTWFYENAGLETRLVKWQLARGDAVSSASSCVVGLLKGAFLRRLVLVSNIEIPVIFVRRSQVRASLVHPKLYFNFFSPLVRFITHVFHYDIITTFSFFEAHESRWVMLHTPASQPASMTHTIKRVLTVVQAEEVKKAQREARGTSSKASERVGYPENDHR